CASANSATPAAGRRGESNSEPSPLQLGSRKRYAVGMGTLLLALVLATPPPTPTARISIDVKDANVIDVVRLLAEVGGFQVVADSGVSCKLTLKLKDVEWPTVLDVALRSCALAQEADGSVVRIAPPSTLLEEATQRRRLDEER